jgi:hypothetical protein
MVNRQVMKSGASGRQRAVRHDGASVENRPSVRHRSFLPIRYIWIHVRRPSAEMRKPETWMSPSDGWHPPRGVRRSERACCHRPNKISTPAISASAAISTPGSGSATRPPMPVRISQTARSNIPALRVTAIAMWTLLEQGWASYAESRAGHRLRSDMRIERAFAVSAFVAQPSSRNAATPRAAASKALSACACARWVTPSVSCTETVQFRSRLAFTIDPAAWPSPSRPRRSPPSARSCCRGIFGCLVASSRALADAPEHPEAAAAEHSREPRPTASTWRPLQHPLHVAARAVHTRIAVEVNVSFSHAAIVPRVQRANALNRRRCSRIGPSDRIKGRVNGTVP